MPDFHITGSCTLYYYLYSWRVYYRAAECTRNEDAEKNTSHPIRFKFQSTWRANEKSKYYLLITDEQYSIESEMLRNITLTTLCVFTLYLWRINYSKRYSARQASLWPPRGVGVQCNVIPIYPSIPFTFYFTVFVFSMEFFSCCCRIYQRHTRWRHLGQGKQLRVYEGRSRMIEQFFCFLFLTFTSHCILNLQYKHTTREDKQQTCLWIDNELSFYWKPSSEKTIRHCIYIFFNWFIWLEPSMTSSICVIFFSPVCLC
jgi:hypothetical protein